MKETFDNISFRVTDAIGDKETYFSDVVANNLRTDLHDIFPEDFTLEQKEKALDDAYVYSVSWHQPNCLPDNNPYVTDSSRDVKEIILDEIETMCPDDDDGRMIEWDNLKKSIESADAASLVNGATIHCPDGYILSIDKISCSSILNMNDIYPDFAYNDIREDVAEAICDAVRSSEEDSDNSRIAINLKEKLEEIFPAELSEKEKDELIDSINLISIDASLPGCLPDNGQEWGIYGNGEQIREWVIDEVKSRRPEELDAKDYDAWENLIDDIRNTNKKIFLSHVKFECPDHYIISVSSCPCRKIMETREINICFDDQLPIACASH